MKKIIPVLLFIIALFEVNGQGVRLIYVDPVADIIKIKNFGGTTVDISSYRFCANFSYIPATLSAMAILNGSLNLAPDSTVSLTGKPLSTLSDLSFYLPTGVFGSSTAMVDFVEWGSSPNGRELVAVAKGIWSTGDFLPGVGPFYYIGDGSATDVGVAFWAGNCLNLFFSEYYEGSSFNKALEIYNPSTTTIDLSNYSVELYNNGATTPNSTLNLSGLLPPGDVYVITHSSATNSNLINKADIISGGVTNFNGNDAVALYYLTAAQDIIGVIGQDSIWPVGAGSTQNNTLVRDSTINRGQTDWSIGATEWIVYPINDSSHIGAHTNDSCGAIICTNFLVSAGLNDTLCAGQSTTLNALAAGGTGNYNFIWNADSTLNDTSIANPIASPSATTNYIVTATDIVTGCGNVDTVTVVVLVLPLPTANAGVDDTVCSGDCSQLLASGGAAYGWSPGAGLSDSTIANPITCPLTTTDYVVTVTDTLGCSDKDTVTILAIPLPFVCIIPIIPPGPMDSFAICLGDSATMMAVGGPYTYSWSPSISIDDSTADTVKAFPTTTTTYTVTGTDIYGCINDTMATVVVSIPTVSVTPSPGTVCGTGDSVMLTASGALTYTWSPSDSLSDTTGAVVYANPSTNILYTVVGTDSIGCADTATVSVQLSTAAPLPDFTADTTSGCDSVTVTFTNTSTNAIGYSWNLPGGTTADTTVQNPVVTYDSVGTFDVTLTAFGCSVDSAITLAGYITVNSIPVANITVSGPTAFCTGTGDSVVLVSDSAGISSYDWLLNGASTGATGRTYNAFIGGNYQVVVWNTFGCGDTSAIVTVTENPLPSVTLAPFTNVCDTTPPFALTGGSPAGGTYSGTGVIANYFYPAIAGVDSHSISYTYVDSVTGCPNSAVQKIGVDSCFTIGVNELFDAANSIRIYPNPANDLIHITFPNSEFSPYTLNIYNVTGQLKVSKIITSDAVIDISGLQSGLYLLNIYNDRDQFTKRVSVVR